MFGLECRALAASLPRPPGEQRQHVPSRARGIGPPRSGRVAGTALRRRRRRWPRAWAGCRERSLPTFPPSLSWVLPDDSRRIGAAGGGRPASAAGRPETNAGSRVRSSFSAVSTGLLEANYDGLFSLRVSTGTTTLWPTSLPPPAAAKERLAVHRGVEAPPTPPCLRRAAAEVVSGACRWWPPRPGDTTRPGEQRVCPRGPAGRAVMARAPFPSLSPSAVPENPPDWPAFAVVEVPDRARTRCGRLAVPESAGDGSAGHRQRRGPAGVVAVGSYPRPSSMMIASRV